jgi:formamidopyrimidine-DNA glycosylase
MAHEGTPRARANRPARAIRSARAIRTRRLDREPQELAASLSRRKGRELLAAVHDVLLKALAEGGTSFDAQYVNVNGASGYFAHSLNAYGQTGRPCPRCGTTIVREPFMNRSSHRCPRCQRQRLRTAR